MYPWPGRAAHTALYDGACRAPNTVGAAGGQYASILWVVRQGGSQGLAWPYRSHHSIWEWHTHIYRFGFGIFLFLGEVASLFFFEFV